MSSLIAAAASGSTYSREHDAVSLSGASVSCELEQLKPSGNCAARGLLTGVVVGAGLWGVILLLTGVIKP